MRRVVHLLVGLSLCVAASPAPLAAPVPPAKPRLAILVAVDGLSWANLMKYRPWYTSGLKRVLDEGRAFSETRYQHINTETSPGHASLSTGAPPRVTGIVGNRWLMRGPDGAIRSVYSTQMSVVPAVPGDPPLYYREVTKDDRLYVFAMGREYERWLSSGELGRAVLRLGEGPKGETVVFDSDDAITLFNEKHDRPAEDLPPRANLTGPGNLRVETFADRLVAAHPRARVVSISAKDRAAILMAGHSKTHAAYWFDRDAGRFVTSPYYETYGANGTAVQSVVSRFNRERAGARLPSRYGTTWAPLPIPPGTTGFGAPLLPSAESNLTEFQVPANGLGFPHDLTFGPNGYFSGFYQSPYMDELLTELAIDLVNDDTLALGQDDVPDALLISYSAQDAVSHPYGPESAENLDLLRRLDRSLGALLDTLQARGLPPSQIVLALSADHGFADIPEATRQKDSSFAGGRLVDGGRVYPSFSQRLNRMVAETLCLSSDSRPLFGGEGWSMTYNHPVLPMRTETAGCGPIGSSVGAAEIDAVLPTVVRRHFAEEIEQVLLVSKKDSWPAQDPIVTFVLNDFDRERSGDAFLIPRFGVLMHDDPIRGTGHGTQHEYDTHVPLVFWGAGWSAGTDTTATTPYDLAPTLAAELGLTLPTATGRSLRPEPTVRPRQ